MTRPAPYPVRRRGVSLIEMLVVISIASVMLGVAVTTIHTLLRAERHGTQAVLHNRTLSRLSRTMRRDVHAARSADVGAAEMKLVMSDRHGVTYRIVEHELLRTSTDDDGVNHRESFYLSPGSSLRFERNGDSPLHRLVIERSRLVEGSAAGTSRTMSIEAALGRDHRTSGTK